MIMEGFVLKLCHIMIKIGCHATSQLSMERLVSKSHSINVTTHDMLCHVICQVSLEGFMLRSRNFKVTTDVKPHVR